jgi:hypothetical protein
LQLADFWCGYIREAVQNFLSNEEKIPPALSELLQKDLNFLGTFNEQVKLFSLNFEIFQLKKSYDDYFKNS